MLTVGRVIKPASRGFTLLELLIAMTILVLLASFAAPSFIQQIKKERLTTHANQIHSLYQMARSEAVKREQTVTLEAISNGWVVKTIENNTEITLNQFSATDESISISTVTRTVNSTGEISAASNILVTDSDDRTEDIRLCILKSGQGWLEKDSLTSCQ